MKELAVWIFPVVLRNTLRLYATEESRIFTLLSLSWLDSIKVWRLKSSQLKSYFNTEHEVLPNGYGVISSSENDLQFLIKFTGESKTYACFKDASWCFWAMSKTSLHWTLICPLQWIDQFDWYLHANYLHAYALHGSVHLECTDHVGWAFNLFSSFQLLSGDLKQEINMNDIQE